MNVIKLLIVLFFVANLANSEEQYEKNYSSSLDGCPIVSLKRKGERLEIIYSDASMPEKERRFDGEISIFHYYKVNELISGTLSWGNIGKESKVVKLKDSLSRELEYFVTDLRDLNKLPDYQGPICLIVTIKVIDGSDGYVLEFNQYGKRAMNLGKADIESKVIWLSGCVFRQMRPLDMAIPLPPK